MVTELGFSSQFSHRILENRDLRSLNLKKCRTYGHWYHMSVACASSARIFAICPPTKSALSWHRRRTHTVPHGIIRQGANCKNPRLAGTGDALIR